MAVQHCLQVQELKSHNASDSNQVAASTSRCLGQLSGHGVDPWTGGHTDRPVMAPSCSLSIVHSNIRVRLGSWFCEVAVLQTKEVAHNLACGSPSLLWPIFARIAMTVDIQY